MTPMIDVIFLLLTFFLLTANFRMPEDFMPIRIPADEQLQMSGIIEPLGIFISARKGGFDVQIGNSEIALLENSKIEEGLEELAEKLKNIFDTQKRRPGDPIEIECSEDVKWESLVNVYHVLNTLGVYNITFNVDQK